MILNIKNGEKILIMNQEDDSSVLVVEGKKNRVSSRILDESDEFNKEDKNVRYLDEN